MECHKAWSCCTVCGCASSSHQLPLPLCLGGECIGIKLDLKFIPLKYWACQGSSSCLAYFRIHFFLLHFQSTLFMLGHFERTGWTQQLFGFSTEAGTAFQHSQCFPCSLLLPRAVFTMKPIITQWLQCWHYKHQIDGSRASFLIFLKNYFFYFLRFLCFSVFFCFAIWELRVKSF